MKVEEEIKEGAYYRSELSYMPCYITLKSRWKNEKMKGETSPRSIRKVYTILMSTVLYKSKPRSSGKVA